MSKIWTYSGLAYKASAALSSLNVKVFRVSRKSAEQIVRTKRLGNVDPRTQRWVLKFGGVTQMYDDRELIALTLDAIITGELTAFDGKAVSI